MEPESLPAVHTGATGTKLLLTAVSPLQGLFDQPSKTHEFLNRQAIIILSRDGLESNACFIQHYLSELNAGIYWADKGWKNVSHYYEPLTGKGLWYFANALDVFSAYFTAAIKSARQLDFAKSVFLLGAAAHLLQDVCVPHHARAKLFSGHKEYENWVKANHTAFSVETQGIYIAHKDPLPLLVNNATAAADFLDWVTEENHTRFHTVSTHLLPLAQQSTAGLFEHFCTMAAINRRNIGMIVA